MSVSVPSDSPSGRNAQSSPARGLHLWLMAVGLAAVAIGVVFLATGGSTTSFGWAGYGTVNDLTFTPEGSLLTTQGLVGLTIGVAGLVMFAFGAGWTFGLRRAQPQPG